MPLVVPAFTMLPTTNLSHLYIDQDDDFDPFPSLFEDDISKALMTMTMQNDEDEEDVPRERKTKPRNLRPAPLGDRTNVQENFEEYVTYAEAVSRGPSSPAVTKVRYAHEDRPIVQSDPNCPFAMHLKNKFLDARRRYQIDHADVDDFDKAVEEGIPGNTQRLRAKAIVSSMKDMRKYYNELAAVVTFYNYNHPYSSERCDLHGLTVREAKVYAKQHIRLSLEHNVTHFDIVTGWGKNTEGGAVAARLKPLMREFFRGFEPAVKITIPPNNKGSFSVDVEDPAELERLLDASPEDKSEDDP